MSGVQEPSMEESVTTKYQVTVTQVTEGEETGTRFQITSPLLTLQVDALHEIAPKLAALYPPPVVKRQHRKQGVAS